MSFSLRALLLELWFFIGLPVLGAVLFYFLRLQGVMLYLFLFALWCWELFAFAHYRYCRQEEFLHVLQTAGATQAPVEGVLAAYLSDRPREEWHKFWVVGLLFFVFPGYYFIHRLRSFDTRVQRVLKMLFNGSPLDRALSAVPGVVSREVALAVTVGQFSGRPREALQRLPDRRLAPQLLELAPRLWYPFIILCVLVNNLVFLTMFVIPKYEKIFGDFHLRLPESTERLIRAGRLLGRPWMVPVAFFLFLIVFNLLLFSSHAKWHLPLIGRFYRMHMRGEFLQTLGLMLETSRPLPEILDHVCDSKLLPAAIAIRAELLAASVAQGAPLAESLVRHGLATRSLEPLIAAAERARNLPWALQELGDSLKRRCVRLCNRIVIIAFPLIIFACACVVALVAVGLFSPLVALMDGIRVK